jgi:hypothetical protein
VQAKQQEVGKWVLGLTGGGQEQEYTMPLILWFLSYQTSVLQIPVFESDSDPGSC